MESTEKPQASPRGGQQPLASFNAALNFPKGFSERIGGEGDPALAAAKEWMVHSRPPKQNFWPALCLALVAQCEATLAASNKQSVENAFSEYIIETSGPAGQPVNTLNFLVNGKKQTLRPNFNFAAEVIRIEMRRDHPSTPAHATQAWRSYEQLIVLLYRMTPPARTRFAEYIWHTGVIEAPERRWATKAERVVRPFEKVLIDFDTRNATPGGALFQALVFGYFSADSPNLTLESHAVNTGSSRADMPGDVAGFRGGEVELAVEVKDFAITVDIVENVLVDFLEDLVEAPNTTAVVVAGEVDSESRARLAGSNVIALNRDDLRKRVATWDLPKQQEALRGALYYLGRIQKKTPLVDRLVGFLATHEIASGVLDQPVLRS